MLENAGGAGCVGPVLRGVVEAALKRQDGGDLLVVGSTQLVPTPVGHDLVDQLQLMIDPVAVGGKAHLPGGRRAAAGRQPGDRHGAILATCARKRPEAPERDHGEELAAVIGGVTQVVIEVEDQDRAKALDLFLPVAVDADGHIGRSGDDARPRIEGRTCPCSRVAVRSKKRSFGGRLAHWEPRTHLCRAQRRPTSVGTGLQSGFEGCGSGMGALRRCAGLI